MKSIGHIHTSTQPLNLDCLLPDILSTQNINHLKFFTR